MTLGLPVDEGPVDVRLLLDLARFHDVTPTAPVPGFPYGERGGGGTGGAGRGR